MNKNLFIVAILFLAFAAGATAVEVPNSFSAGQTASADEVNENFQVLADAINGLETDYTGLAPINVDAAARTIGLNAGTSPNDVLTWDGNNWVSRQPPTPTGTVSNMQPYLGVNFIIALIGTFPSRNSADPFLAEIIMFGGNFAPRGWALCDGQLLPISQNQALFSLLGTTYGGDGVVTFGLPDLRGRVPLHPGMGPGLTNRNLGEEGGSETIQR